jgi:peptidoglycan/LPS O-acetylase OafA/YrhL
VPIPNPEITTPPAPDSPKPAHSAWLDAWHVNPTLNKDYDAVDGLRGFAILMVLACHFLYFNPAASEKVRFIGGIFGAGYWGVTIFFCLSGFLISHPFWKRKLRGSQSVIPPGYFARRFWKIYPPLALSVLILTPIYIARSGDPAYLTTAAHWLAGWAWVHPVSSRINPAMWSLIVEVHFYVFLPVLFIAAKRLAPKPAIWTLFLILLLGPTLFRWFNASHGIYFTLHPIIDVHFPSLLDSFAFGILLAGFENLQRMPKSWARLGDIGFVFLAASLLATSWFNLHPVAQPELQQEMIGWAVKISAALMLCYVADPNHPRTRLFSQPWLRWCGLISYEWYLFHQPLIFWARESFGPAGGNLAKYAAVVGGSFLLSLAVAAATYRFFSLPIHKFALTRRPPSNFG